MVDHLLKHFGEGILTYNVKVKKMKNFIVKLICIAIWHIEDHKMNQKEIPL